MPLRRCERWAFRHENLVMSANKPAGEDKKDTTVVANDAHAPRGALKHIGGSQSDNWNDILAPFKRSGSPIPTMKHEGVSSARP